MSHSQSGDKQIEFALDSFEDAWSSGTVPWLSQYARDELPVDQRRLLIAELIMIDLYYRWVSAASEAAGEVDRKRLADYLQQYPEMHMRDALGRDLIREEFRCRWLAGDRVDIDSYCAEYSETVGLREELVQLERDMHREAPRRSARPARQLTASRAALADSILESRQSEPQLTASWALGWRITIALLISAVIGFLLAMLLVGWNRSNRSSSDARCWSKLPQVQVVDASCRRCPRRDPVRFHT